MSGDLAGAIASVLIFLGCGALVLTLGVVLHSRSYRRRRARVQAWAAERGWTYRAEAPELVDRWTRFPFGPGYDCRATEVITGTFRGRSCLSMSFQRTDKGERRDDSPVTSLHHVVAVPLPVAVPSLVMSPEHSGTRLQKFLGWQDIEVNSEAFNQRWRLTGQAPADVRRLLTPWLMDRLLAPDGGGLTIVFEGVDVYAVRSGQQDEQTIEPTLALLSDVADLVPAAYR